MNTERPDDDAARDRGTGRDSADATTDAGVTEGGEPAHGDDGGSRGPRRSRGLVAVVVAAVVAVGGGGAYLAASASGGSGASPGADGGSPPPLALDGYAEGGGTHGIAPGEPDPNGVTYRASGALPDGPGSAAVYRARGEVTEAEVARLAAALGLDGKPVAEGQAWRVGGQDGQGPSLQVNRQAPGTWTFHRYSPGTDNCQSPTTCAKDQPGGDPVGEAAAKKAAAPVLKAVGQDDAKLDAGQVMGAQRTVNADPVIGGLPTYGWPTGVTVGSQGEVVGGSGQLKAPVKGDTYPVLTADDTLKLMNSTAPGTVGSGRGGVGGCASAVPLEESGPCEGATGAPRTAEAAPIEVESAVFGLASHFVDARQTLVPSWLFEVRAPGAEDGFTVTYPAVEPEFLKSPRSEEPPARPSPRPTGPGDEPSTRALDVEAYTTEGSELTVAFTAGVCADYTVTAQESAEKVTVKVIEKPWKDQVCILIAKVHHRTVQLDEPLGDREVVGTDGKAVPLEKPGARLPR
ncbi:hypothetical protein [Streptomyces sp. NPDC057877]|uniref:hypothetical protein n=1 Tax=Streptomyces sp. NPDC057877 TaxID=3346269 RepID=UPI0036A3F933